MGRTELCLFPFPAGFLDLMHRIQIASDDGHSCTFVLSGNVTVLKVIEEYCRLRKISDPVNSAEVGPTDCILTRHLSGPNTEAEHLGNDIKLSAVLSSKGTRSDADGIAAKYGLVGYAHKKSLSAIARIDAFAGHLASLFTLDNLLVEDAFLESACNTLEPTVMKAGDTVCLADGREIQIPVWLKGVHPQCAVPTIDTSLVNFSLPLQANIFYRNMETHTNNSFMGEVFRSIDTSNILLIGASGCGKTSAVFALAAKRYVIFLECPAGSEWSRADSCRGYRMSTVHWWGHLQTKEQVDNLFCCELAARLIVLANMLRQHRETLTPLSWLHYIQSREGEARIGKVFDRLICFTHIVTFVLVQQLLSLVHERQVRVGGRRADQVPPFLFVDEVQMFESLPAVTCTTDNTKGSMSVIKAMMRGAGMLTWGVVWSGTRVSVTATSGEGSAGIAEQRRGSRGLSVVGDFQYMRPKDVGVYLNAVLKLNASDNMRQQLCHLLQGRASTVTGFIALLLTPVWDERTGCVALRGGNKERLDDEVLRDTLEVFMESFVVRRFLTEINSLRNLPGEYALNRDDLNHLWRLSMIQSNESTPVSKRALVRLNSLPFTNHVYETTYAVCSPATVNYAFDYTFGEPGLQQALRSIMLKGEELAET